MGERAGNANLGEVALALPALYGVESNLRLDRIRAVSDRVRELSGYELEPWKPVTGETLYRRESGAVASQFHDPPSIEPYSSELVSATRSIVLGKKSGLDSIRIKADELGLDVPEERHAELLAAVKELGTLAAPARHRRGVRRARPAAAGVIRRVCVAGSGVIGSLLAGHLAQVCEVSVLARRDEHARALNADGLRVTGRADLHGRVTAATVPADLPDPDLVLVCCKGTDLEAIGSALEGHFADATVMTTQNGLGADEIVGRHGDWPMLTSVTFMSGTRHSDTSVEYILDTATWIGPSRGTTGEDARAVAELVRSAGP